MSKAMGRWKLDGGQCYERQSFILKAAHPSAPESRIPSWGLTHPDLSNHNLIL